MKVAIISEYNIKIISNNLFINDKINIKLPYQNTNDIKLFITILKNIKDFIESLSTIVIASYKLFIITCI